MIMQVMMIITGCDDKQNTVDLRISGPQVSGGSDYLDCIY